MYKPEDKYSLVRRWLVDGTEYRLVQRGEHLIHYIVERSVKDSLGELGWDKVHSWWNNTEGDWTESATAMAVALGAK